MEFFSTSVIWSVDVHNVGQARSPATTVRVLSGGRTLDTDSLYALSAGSTFGFAWGRFSANIPDVGDRVSFCVDRVANERNTANNCRTHRIIAGSTTGRGRIDDPAVSRTGHMPVPQALQAFQAWRDQVQLQEAADRL